MPDPVVEFIEVVRPDGVVEMVPRPRRQRRRDVPLADREWVSVRRACDVIDCSPAKMWQLLKRGRIRSAKLDGKRLVEVKSLLDLIEGGVVTANKE